MSSPSLCMLVRLMVAQVQECVFERVTLTTQDAGFTSQLRLAREAARVSDVYLLVQQTMTQPLMKDYVPFSWVSMVQVKAEHFRALSHYHAAVALCDHMSSSEGIDEEAEKTFLQFYVSSPASPTLNQVLQDQFHVLVSSLGKCLATKWMLSGKAHLRCAVIRHEEAMRVHSLCKILRKMDILQDVLSVAHKRSLDRYSELDREDDFDETAEAPEIQCKSYLWGFPVCSQVERRAVMASHSSDKENTRLRLLSGAKGQSSASLLNWNRKKKREVSGVTKTLGSTFSLSFGSIRDTESMY